MSLLSMEGICKSFYGVPVLKNVNLTLEKGEVHALLGENGAGKSTLMNILTGVLPKDQGRIVFDGKNLESITIRQSEELGIAFVHQELNLFNDLRVYENIFLMKEYTKGLGYLDKKRMITEVKKLFDELGVEIDPEERVENLKTSQKQLLEISKALFFQAKLLILDEPTTSLNNDEVAHLFGIIRNLKKNGTAFVFISHKMPEIFEIADKYTVFRNGTFVETGNIKDRMPEQITMSMVGDSYDAGEVYTIRKTGETVLKLNHLSGKGFHNIHMEIKKGQIIGLTGLQGSGSSELLQAIFGSIPVYEGTMEIFGKKVSCRSIHKAMRSKIAMLASNRKENSVIADMSLLENMYVAEHTLSAGKFHIHKKEEGRKFDHYKELLKIKAGSMDEPIVSLSGGNQQKVFLARWLNTEAEILLLDNPTQGIDVGAKAEIYRLILKLAESGKTILINTLEIPEIQKVADVCAVFYESSIVKILGHDEINERTVMLYATNAVADRKGISE